jgi:hypothetical protein
MRGNDVHRVDVMGADSLAPRTDRAVRRSAGAALLEAWSRENPRLLGFAIARLRRYDRGALTVAAVETVLDDVEHRYLPSPQADAPKRSMNPTETRAWLAEPKGFVRKGFVREFGQVRYNSVAKNGPQASRIQYLADALCEVDGCETGGHEKLVFDHCHEHGWVRAVLCYKHNTRLGHLEAVLRECVVDLSGTPYGLIVANCAGCGP